MAKNRIVQIVDDDGNVLYTSKPDDTFALFVMDSDEGSMMTQTKMPGDTLLGAVFLAYLTDGLATLLGTVSKATKNLTEILVNNSLTKKPKDVKQETIERKDEDA